MANLSLIKLWNNTTVISIWGKYQYLSTEAISTIDPYFGTSTFYTNVWSFGLDFELNLSKFV
jgi:hypothetical protein